MGNTKRARRDWSQVVVTNADPYLDLSLISIFKDRGNNSRLDTPDSSLAS